VLLCIVVVMSLPDLKPIPSNILRELRHNLAILDGMANAIQEGIASNPAFDPIAEAELNKTLSQIQAVEAALERSNW